MKKRVLAAVSALIMAFACMTACGNSSSTAAAEPSSKAESSTSDSGYKPEIGENDRELKDPDVDIDDGQWHEEESSSDTASESSSKSDSSKAEEKQEDKEVLLKEEYYEANTLRSYNTYQYEKDAQSGHYIRTEKNGIFHSKDSVEEKVRGISEYDENQKIIAEYYPENKKIKAKYEYNGEGKVAKCTRYDAKGAVSGYTEYEYTDSRVTGKSYSKDGALTQTRISEYSNGKLIKESTTPNGMETVYTYNEKGNLIKKQSTNDVIALENYEYEYYDDGGYKQTIKRTNPDGSTFVLEENIYNSKGQLTNKNTLKGHYERKYTYGKLP